MTNVTIIGIDLAKSIFQVCGLNRARKVVFNQSISRTKLCHFIKDYPQALIAMEACGSSHHWGRTFTGMGHQVRLIPAQHVKAFCHGNKNDANDALAIAESVLRPALHDVPIKTLEQQDIQTLLRIRTRLKNTRKDTVNQIRGLLHEYGLIMPKTIAQFDRHLPQLLEQTENGLTDLARTAVNELYLDHQALSIKIHQADRQLKQLAQHHQIAQQLMRLRGIGPITALALYACIGAARQFNNARQLAAWLGLVPKHSGSGSTVRLGAISKRGNGYLRVLLVHGARTVLNWMKNKNDAFSQWAKQLVQRRGKHKAIVAIAHKTARMVWVVLHHGVDAVPKQHLAVIR